MSGVRKRVLYPKAFQNALASFLIEATLFPVRDNIGYRLAMAGDNNRFTGLSAARKVGKLVLGLLNRNFVHFQM